MKIQLPTILCSFRPLPHYWATYVVALFLCVAIPAAAYDCTDGGPDFSDNEDILDGQRYLSRIDDLIFSNPKQQKAVARLTDEDGDSPNEVTSTKSGSKLSSHSEAWFTSRGARLADLPYDFVVSTVARDDSLVVQTLDPDSDDNLSKTIDVNDPVRQLAVADFDGDAFDDVVIFTDYGIYPYTADDTSASFDGTLVRKGERAQLGFRYIRGAPTIGDLNNDSNLDIAWLSPGDDEEELTVYFATVCGRDLTAGVCDGADPLDVIIASSYQVISDADVGSHCHWHGENDYLLGALAAGDFDSSDSGDELMVVYCNNENKDAHVYLIYYEVDADFGLTEEDKLKIDDFDHHNDELLARSAVFDFWSDDSEAQLVLGFSGHSSSHFRVEINIWGVDTGSGDPELTQFSSTEKQVDDDGPVYWQGISGLAIGRFDSDTEDADAYDLSLAFVLSRQVCQNSDGSDCLEYQHLIYTVDVDDGYALENTQATDFNYWENAHPNGDLLWPADVQGRATRLGEPEVVRIESQTQPSMILGVPPMHVDYMLPDSQTSSSRTVVNLSAVQTGYNATYSFSESSSEKVESKSKTSYSHAYKSEEEGKAKFGVAGTGVKASTKQSQKWTYQNTTSKANTDYDEVSSSATSTTGFSDQLWYQTYMQSLYYYPVLGECACPDDASDCTEDDADSCSGEAQPVYVVYSGPQDVCQKSASGSTLEWYQPVTQPGQVFSYPSSLAWLEDEVDGLDQLSDTREFYTDDSAQTFTVSWKSSSEDSIETGSSQGFEYDSSYSVTVGGGDNSVSSGFSYSKSNSTENQVVNTATLSASDGVTIKTPGSFQDADLYQYLVAPYVFGQSLAEGTVDDTDGCSETDGTCQSTSGMLRTRYAADPLDSDAGSWWNQSEYASRIDLAINHPRRWTSKTGTRCNSLNCLTVSTSSASQNCMRFNEATEEPADVWTNMFYSMRGLIVQVDAPTGPQQISATAGDDVYLTARVYNYSLTEMSDDETVHVRFYRQPWDTENQEPQSGTASVLIEEVTTDADDLDLRIPAFTEDADADPNWIEVTTAFDTTDLGDTDQVFWVLVWAEDSDGNLVDELTAHGLSASPDSLDEIDFVTDVVPILETASWSEYRKDSSGSCEEVDITDTPFSNNVGVFKQSFHIAAADTSSSTSSRAETNGFGAASASYGQAARDQSSTRSLDDPLASRLAISNLRALHNVVYVDEPTEVEAEIKAAAGQDLRGVSVALVETDASGRISIIDEDLLARVRADRPHGFRVPLRAPRECGEHELTLVAAPGTGRIAQATLPLSVACEATALSSMHGRAETGGAQGLPGSLELRAIVSLKNEGFQLADINFEQASLSAHSLLQEADRKLFPGIFGPEGEPPRIGPIATYNWLPGIKGALFAGARDGVQASASIVVIGGVARLHLKVEVAEAFNPHRCDYPRLRTDLDTRLVIDDGEHEPVLVRLGGTWQCAVRPDGSTVLTTRK